MAPRMLNLNLLIASLLLAVSAVEAGPSASAFQVTFVPAEAKADPARFQVRLQAEGEPSSEKILPCGQMVTLDRRPYVYWLEGPAAISPYPATLRPADGTPSSVASEHVMVPVVPAGRVRLAAGAAVPGAVLQLLATTSHRLGETAQAALFREVSGEQLKTGVLMPAGTVVAALRDPRSRETLALSRPLPVQPGQPLELNLVRPPAGTTDLSIILERPLPLATFADDDLALRLTLEGEATPRFPDLVVPERDRIRAIWYELQGRRGTLGITSREVFLPATDLVLRPGKVETLAGNLRLLPALEVQLDLPDVLRREPLVLEVLDLPSRDSLRRLELARETVGQSLPRLPPRPLEILLRAGVWLWRERVDLSDGNPQTLTFAPQPIVLSGTVFRGDQGHPARLAFIADLSAEKRVLATADAAGKYEVVLFREGTYVVEIRWPEMTGPPHLDFFDVEGSTPERDFHLAAALHLVRVEDARDGRPIAGAEVAVGNEEPEGKSTSQRAETGEDGLSELPPLRPGKLTLQARAKGYQPSPVLEEPIAEGATRREFVLRLQPESPTLRWRIRMLGGKPAAGAELRLLTSLDAAGQELWQGHSDARGNVEFPQPKTAAWLLVRHAQAASQLRLLVPPETPLAAERELLLAPASPAPLRLSIRNRWQEPASWAELAVWIEGVRVAGGVLSWLTWGQLAGANREGFWQGQNLPRTPLHVLAWSRSQREAAQAGNLDSLAVTVPYPWPDPVVLEAIE